MTDTQTMTAPPSCGDCGRPRTEPGVPAICAAWHRPAANERIVVAEALRGQPNTTQAQAWGTACKVLDALRDAGWTITAPPAADPPAFYCCAMCTPDATAPSGPTCGVCGWWFATDLPAGMRCTCRSRA